MELIFFVAAIIVILFAGAGMLTATLSPRIDYKKRWQEANALLQGGEVPQLESGGWTLEARQSNGTVVGGKHHGEACKLIILYAKKGKNVMQIPYGNRGVGLVMGGDDFVEQLEAYKVRAIETAKSLEDVMG